MRDVHMMQLVANEKAPITPFIHKVHTYYIWYDVRICKYSKVYYDIRMCTCRYSQGEGAHYTLHSEGTHTYYDIIIFEDRYSREAHAHVPQLIHKIDTSL